jgi:ABC-type Fe3+-siderophore transport system permease subunit
MTKWSEYLTKMELWRSSLKKIEGNFGTGVVAYFVFLRWLMVLNLLIFTIIFMFIILPQLVLIEPKDAPCDPYAPPVFDEKRSNVNESLWIYANTSVQCCRESYINEIKRNRSEISILHLFQGTGFMEKTFLFYGMYTHQIYGYDPLSSQPQLQPQTGDRNQFVSNQNLDNLVVEENSSNISSTSNNSSPIMSALLGFSDQQNATTDLTNFTTWREFFSKLDIYYDLPLAYIIVTIVCYLYTLVAIVKAVAHEFKDRLVEGEGQFYQYCNLIFCGWDFSLHNEKSAQIKHKALFNEVQALMHIKRYEFERNNRTRDIMFKLYLIRVFINILVCIILIVCGAAIFILFNTSLAFIEPNFETVTRYRSFNVFMGQLKTFSKGASDIDQQFKLLFYEFLPYLCIVIFNLLVPILFNYLIQFEQYSPLFVIKMNLFRTIGLRLSSLAVLISRFYYLISAKNENKSTECYNEHYGTPQCWETFIGQQFYKLFIVDFATHIFVTFFVNFPRAMIARHMNNAFARFIEMDFELSKHVLDVVYSQTICWLGTFYAPFLPAIAAMLIFFMFYIKKFACLVNSKPSAILYRASRSNSLFMIILLLSFSIAIIPVVYAIAEIMPSRSCGPFRGLDSVWERAINAFEKLPKFLQDIIFFFGTSSFAIPCFIVLILFLYYYYSVSAANKHMVQVLKNQLVLEGHDKQFLLNRLSLFIKQQQEYQKRIQRQFYDQASTTTNSQQSHGINMDTIPPPLLPRAPRSETGSNDRSERSSVEIKHHSRMSKDIGDI